jgi:copper homeostasis protein
MTYVNRLLRINVSILRRQKYEKKIITFSSSFFGYPMKRLLEVCIDNIESGIIAESAGADRIELCDNLAEGGTTPSLGAIRLAKKRLQIPVNIIIRPRGGDFLYSDAEYMIMMEDIRIAREEGINGVVLGILKPDGHIDIERTSALVQLAEPMEVTFHRAYDMTPDPFIALEEVIMTGAARLLTSAHDNFVYNNAKLIKELIENAAGRIIIMPGAGINENNIADIINKTNAREYHLTGRKPVESMMEYRKDNIYMGGKAEQNEYSRSYTSSDIVQKVRKILDSYN